MSDPRPESQRALDEAASWFVQLSRRSVTTQALRDFRAWRQSSDNAAAYAHVESTWTAAGDLSADPAIRKATEAALTRPARSSRLEGLIGLRPKPWLLGGAALAGTAVALFLLLPTLQPTYRTGIGEQRLVVLEDGSRVHLNTDSQIRVHFTGARRDIELARGEAFFEAAHDTARPFIVNAGLADVRAIGTRFDVRRSPDVVHVMLVQGQVSVRRDGEADSWTLKPNQKLEVTRTGAAALTQADPEQATGWTNGRLTFHATPLAEAVDEVNRYSAHKVQLDVDGLSRAPVSGVFNTGDTEAFVAAVSSLFGLKAEPKGDGVILKATHS
ncbi:MAG TPA: FecR family protein [Phenylobacterium sp.]|nr:FecR family protein [Phenylobacterium sp.]